MLFPAPACSTCPWFCQKTRSSFFFGPAQGQKTEPIPLPCKTRPHVSHPLHASTHNKPSLAVILPTERKKVLAIARYFFLPLSDYRAPFPHPISAELYVIFDLWLALYGCPLCLLWYLPHRLGRTFAAALGCKIPKLGWASMSVNGWIRGAVM